MKKLLNITIALLFSVSIAYAGPKHFGSATLGTGNTTVCTSTSGATGYVHFQVFNYGTTSADGIKIYAVFDNATIDNSTLVYMSQVSPLSAYGGYYETDLPIPIDRDNVTIMGLDNRTSNRATVRCFGANE